MAGEEDPRALVLDAIASGPVPLHVVISKTGLRSHEVNKAARALEGEGRVLYRGNMIGPPEPSYVPPPTEEYEDVADRVEVADIEPQNAVFDGDHLLAGQALDEAVEGPDVPVERPPVGPVPQDFFVATELSASAGGLGAGGGGPGAWPRSRQDEVLVLPAEAGEIFERATVTRKKAHEPARAGCR